MRLLFLDIDGVLNGHEPLDPEVMCGRIHADKVAMLNDVLRETGARVVLSSAWRYLVHRGEMNLKGLGWLLQSHGILADRLIGITRKDHMRESPEFDGQNWPVYNERGQQILDYLYGIDLSKIDAYAVVDDLDLGISAAGHPFVQTNGQVGMQIDDARRLVELLTVG